MDGRKRSLECRDGVFGGVLRSGDGEQEQHHKNHWLGNLPAPLRFRPKCSKCAPSSARHIGPVSELLGKESTLRWGETRSDIPRGQGGGGSCAPSQSTERHRPECDHQREAHLLARPLVGKVRDLDGGEPGHGQGRALGPNRVNEDELCL